MELLLAAAYSIWAALTPAVPYLGNCLQHSGSTIPITKCHYEADETPLRDELRTAAGKFMMAGPWATEAEIIHLSLQALANGRTTIMNTNLQGLGIVINGDAHGAFITNTRIDLSQPHAAITVTDGATRP